MRKQLTFVLSMIILLTFVYAINFGDPSPDTGEADAGTNTGTFNTEANNFTATRTNDTTYFAVGRNTGTDAAANQTIAFNISKLSTNTSIKITGINVSLTYCHARTVTNICNSGGGATPQGTNSSLKILLYNNTGNNWTTIGNIPATTTATEQTTAGNKSGLTNYSAFINPAGFVNISFEFAWTGTGRSAFLNDHTRLIISYDAAPLVTLNSPANNSLINGSTGTTFNCSATDDNGLVNITLYHNLNGSGLFVANQTNFVGGTSNSTTFTVGGTFERTNGLWNCLALDNNNLSNFAATNFTIDTSYLNITPTGCMPTNIDMTESSICNATITDNLGVSNVTANVTLPNSTLISVLVSNTSTNYFINITNTVLNGTYRITWYANDTLNNNKSDSTTTFTAGNIAPNVTLVNPVNAFNSSTTTQTFTFNGTDERDTTIRCSLIFNATSNQTNTSVTSGINSTFTLTAIRDGTYPWTVNCSDSGGLSDQPATRNISIDTKPPNFNSLTTTPSDTDGLDPQVDILVQANISDNTTTINNSRAFLEKKRSNQNDFTQVLMTYDSVLGLYNATMNENAVGTYNLRINATDIVGNSDVSTQLNITLQRERTWIDTPTRLILPARNFSQNGSAIYKVNNTGDFTLRFNITSNYSLTFFNETEQYDLLAKALKPINITATAGTTTFTKFTINTTAVDATDTTIAAEPPSRTTEAIVVVAPNQPILLAEFTSIPNNVTQGQSNIELQARLQNLGEGNATNTSFNITIPGDWTIVSGSTNINASTLFSGDEAATSFLVNIPITATTGSKTLIANATAQNDTGSNLEPLGLIFSDTREVTVNAITGLGGGGAGAGGGGGGAGAAGAGGGGRQGFSINLIKTLTTEEFLKTNETITVVRGETIRFPFKVTNVYENTTLSKVTLSIQGYLSQYFAHKPAELTNIPYKANKNFDIDITSPGYFKGGTYNLIFDVRGTASGRFHVNKNGATETVSSIVRLTESRNVTLVIYEIEPRVARALLEQSRKLVQRMQQKGLPLNKANTLYEQIENDYTTLQWAQLQTHTEELQQLATNAITTIDTLTELYHETSKAKKQRLNVTSTELTQEFARAAMLREDFTTARARVEEARLISFLETKGAIDILGFIEYYWWAMILTILTLSATSYVTYRKIFIMTIHKRIKNIITEELSINNRIKELQEATFKHRTITTETYHKTMYEYETRRENLKRLLAKLKTKRLAFTPPEEHLKKLQHEKNAILNMMKQTQEHYFVTQTLSKKAYDNRIQGYQQQLSDIEEDIIMTQTKHAQNINHQQQLAREYHFKPTFETLIKLIRHQFKKNIENTVRLLHGI